VKEFVLREYKWKPLWAVMRPIVSESIIRASKIQSGASVSRKIMFADELRR